LFSAVSFFFWFSDFVLNNPLGRIVVGAAKSDVEKQKPKGSIGNSGASSAVTTKEQRHRRCDELLF
jgi:hypothetical protein